MTSSTVLVPLQVDALVVNNAPRYFIRTPREYAALGQVQSPDQLAFPTPEQAMEGGFGQNAVDRGVHLMWTLPAGLRRGRQDDSGAINFPLVPTRGGVARWAGPPQARTSAAWGIESDYLGADGSSPFVEGGDSGGPVATRIGRHTALSPGIAWAPPSGVPPFLTAVGPGDPGFALFQSGIEDVFSFHDQFDDAAPGIYSYAVAGWYSDPAADVLADTDLGQTVAERLATLNWTAADGALPVSVYHGAIFGVLWDANQPMEPQGRLNAKAAVAVANTGVDGLKAFVEAAPGSPVDADLLEAFQYGLLDTLNQSGADAAIDTARRTAAFVAEPAGTVWEIVNAGTDATSAPAGSLTPAQIAAEAALLQQLNADQTSLEAARRSLASQRRRLLELWWKQQFAAHNAVTIDTGQVDALLGSAAGSLPNAVKASLDTIAQVSARLPTGATSAALQSAMDPFNARLSTGRVLKAAPKPPRYTPAPPVLLIAGVNHGIDPMQGDVLATRTTDQIITAVAVPGTDARTGLTSAAVAGLMQSFNLGTAPPAAAALLAEAFLLDPANATQFGARVLGTSQPAQITALAAALCTPVPLAPGVTPAIWPKPWVQPWLPLYVDWQVNWFDLPFDQWRFDGSDYAWQGPGTTPGWSPRPIPYSGRSFLAPQPAFVFARRLQKFIADYPQMGDEATLAAAVQAACGWDLLTQSLAGLPDWIALRDPRAHLAPDDQAEVLPGTGLTMAGLIGNGLPYPPQSINARPPHHGDSVPPYFSGMRAGQFCITHLRVLDRYGQSLDLLGNDVTHPAALTIADDLRTDTPVTVIDGQNFITLPPRVLQAARLCFDFAAQTSDGSLAVLLPGDPGNPVAGWIMPNHLDGALAAYDAAGAYLGELAVATDGSALVWLPGPDPSCATLAGVTARAPDLGATLAALQAQGVSTWQVFLSVVDETLWTVEPLGARSDEVISALVGRPLAVVRTAVSLDLAEDALREPSWPSTLAPTDAPLPGLCLPVRLGDLGRRADGLIGYFETADFSTFHSVHDPATSGGQTAPFVTPIGQDGYLQLSFDAAPRLLTLLMDPRAAVGATTGLLPLTEARIPDRFVTPALRNLSISLRTGPVLTRFVALAGKADTPPVTALRLPVPATQAGVWTWAEPGLTLPLAPTNQSAELQDAASLREGLLVLTGGVQENG